MTGSDGRARLVGSVTRSGDAVVDVVVHGDAGSWTLACVIDTGYSGELALPVAVIDQLGLPFATQTPLRLITGERIAVPSYWGAVDWIGERRRVFVDALTGRDCLVGSALLTPHHLAIDYAQRTLTIT